MVQRLLLAKRYLRFNSADVVLRCWLAQREVTGTKSRFFRSRGLHLVCLVSLPATMIIIRILFSVSVVFSDISTLSAGSDKTDGRRPFSCTLISFFISQSGWCQLTVKKESPQVAAPSFHYGSTSLILSTINIVAFEQALSCFEYSAANDGCIDQH